MLKVKKIMLCGCLLSGLLAGCKKSEKDQTVRSDKSFENYSAGFIESLWKQYPDWATSAGYHNYDSVLVVPDEKSVQSSITFAKRHLDSLSAFDPTGLSASNRTDFYMIRNLLNESLWSSDTLKSYKWDPTSYNVSGTFAFILNEKYAPLNERLRSIGGDSPMFLPIIRQQKIQS